MNKNAKSIDSLNRKMFESFDDWFPSMGNHFAGEYEERLCKAWAKAAWNAALLQYPDSLLDGVHNED